MDAPAQPSKGKTIALWIVTGLLTLAFLASGGVKLAGLQFEKEGFAKLGYPLWFMYVTGLAEAGGAILIAIPRTAGLGALILACTMVGAVLTHLTHDDAAHVGPAAVLLVLSLVVLYARRDTLLKLLGRDRRA